MKTVFASLLVACVTAAEGRAQPTAEMFFRQRIDGLRKEVEASAEAGAFATCADRLADFQSMSLRTPLGFDLVAFVAPFLRHEDVRVEQAAARLLAAYVDDQGARSGVGLSEKELQVLVGTLTELEAIPAALAGTQSDRAWKAAWTVVVVGAPDEVDLRDALELRLGADEERVREWSMRALARIDPKNERLVAALPRLLASSNGLVRAFALDAIAAAVPGTNPSVEPWLVTLLDVDGTVARRAMEVVPLLDPAGDRIAPFLLESLRNEDDGPRERALSASCWLDELLPGEDLLALVESESDGVRASALEVLGLKHAWRIDSKKGPVPPALHAAVLASSRSSGARTRAAAVSAHAWLCDDDAEIEAEALRAFDDPDAEVRRKAVRGSFHIAEDAPERLPLHHLITGYIARLRDEDVEVRRFAATGLARCIGIDQSLLFRMPEATSALIAAFIDPDLEVRRAILVHPRHWLAVSEQVVPALVESCVVDGVDGFARSALGEIFEIAEPWIVDGLDHREPAIRESCVELIGRRNLPGTSGLEQRVSRLVPALRDPVLAVRARAAFHLSTGSIDEPDRRLAPELMADLVAAMRRLLGDADPLVRAFALNSLEHVGPRAAAALPEVHAATSDPVQAVRFAAEFALLSIQEVR